MRRIALGALAIAATLATIGFATPAPAATSTATAWGADDNGQLGDGSRTSTTLPRAVGALGSGVASISLGNLHSCAVTTAGALYCWGLNGTGRDTCPNGACSATPVAVALALADPVFASVVSRDNVVAAG